MNIAKILKYRFEFMLYKKLFVSDRILQVMINNKYVKIYNVENLVNVDFLYPSFGCIFIDSKKIWEI